MKLTQKPNSVARLVFAVVPVLFITLCQGVQAQREYARENVQSASLSLIQLNDLISQLLPTPKSQEVGSILQKTRGLTTTPVGRRTHLFLNLKNNGKKHHEVLNGEEVVLDEGSSMEDQCDLTITNGTVILTNASLRGRGRIIIDPKGNPNNRAKLWIGNYEDLGGTGATLEADELTIGANGYLVLAGGQKKTLNIDKITNKNNGVIVPINLPGESNLIEGTGTIENKNGGLIFLANPPSFPILPGSPQTLPYTTSGLNIYNSGMIRGGGIIHGNVKMEPTGTIDLSTMILPPPSGGVGPTWVSSPSPSLITITGSLNASSGSVTENIQVTGTNTSTHGQLAVYGTVTVSGARLAINTTNGTATKPTVGATFDFIKATDVTGTGFASPTFTGSVSYALGTAGGPPGSPSCPPYDCYFLTRN